jgi:hypothetical protein
MARLNTGTLLLLSLVNIFTSVSLGNSQQWITSSAIGPVSIESGEAELRKLLGPSEITDFSLMAEGETQKATAVFFKDKDRRIEIVWKNKQRKKPYIVTTRGRFWKTKSGFGTGTSLKELEMQNGKPFTLTGFGWDYSGTLCSWEGGKLEKVFTSPTSRIGLRFEPSVKNYQEKPIYHQVVGGDCFPSSHPAMQFLNPLVYEITLQ